jgi:monovalent cation:H+ antiporter-2, CPA2 family
MQSTLLSSLVVIFGLSIAVLLLCYRLRVPTIVGFLATGILAGPHGLRLITESKDVEILSQIGVELLLFTIGIEFSLKTLLSIKKAFFIGGSIQVLVSILVVALISIAMGRPIIESIFIGFVVSLSSTAIVLKRLQEKAEVESPHGKMIIAILIYQDLIVIPMLLLLPFFTGVTHNPLASIGVFAGKILLICLLMAIGIKWIAPKLLFQIAKTRSREIFLLSIIVLCFSVAWLTSSIGLSFALGAFLAGMIISESEYSYQALGNMLPFRDVFTSIFFISIGMLFDISYFIHHPALVLLLTLGVIVVKSLIASAVPGIIGFPLRTMALVGLALSQVGEFSFILLQTGQSLHFLGNNTYQMLLNVTVCTMIATPFIMASGTLVVKLALKLPIPERMKSGFPAHWGALDALNSAPASSGHLVVIGYGMCGRHVTQVAKIAGIQYVILEMNPETVRNERAKGEPIFYGDATQEAVLNHLHVNRARVAVVAIPDPVATREVIETMRGINPTIHLIVRTRFFQEMEPLVKLGANEVIPEEFETSVEIFTRVLMNYLVPRDKIEKYVTDVRSGGYQMLRSFSKTNHSFSDLEVALPDVQISTLSIHSSSTVVGRTLSEIELRKRFEVTLLAIRRGSEIFSNPAGNMRLLGSDMLILLGNPEKISLVAYLMKDKRA